MYGSSAPSSLTLAVRFAVGRPDVVLPVPDPTRTAPLALLPRLRAALPAPYNAARIRLIHAGHVLPLTGSLAAALRLPAGPPWAPLQAPSPQPPAPEPEPSSRAKGKAPVRPVADHDGDALRSAAPTPVYIHAAFAGNPEADAGALLSAADLAAESAAAERAEAALQHHKLFDSDEAELNLGRPAGHRPTAAAAPQGFDRLRAAGLSAAEVAALRAQFVARLAHGRTPDAMPGPATLRALEERWLDEDAEGPAGAAHGGGGGREGAEGTNGTVGGGLDVDEESASLDDMLWGNLLGFFWPVGALGWLGREEGAWSRRRQLAVLTGFMVNVVISIVRSA